MRDRTKVAALILAWLETPYELAKAMTEDEIIGMVEFDHHPIRKADGGSNHPSNIRPLLRHDHLAKTKLDMKDMAKERKVKRAVAEHELRMKLKKIGREIKEVRRRWPKRRLRS